MGRTALHSDSVKIEQKAPIVDHEKYEGDIVIADKPFHKDYLDELAFQEEPVTIILNPSSEKNAPTAMPVWVNGKGAEVLPERRLAGDRLSAGRPQADIKRKYLEVIIRAKLDAVTTMHDDATVERPRNESTAPRRRCTRSASWKIKIRRARRGPRDDPPEHVVGAGLWTSSPSSTARS
jgi:hypothetical protein